MAQRVLLVTAMSVGDKWSASITRQLGVTVQMVEGRGVALAALRSREYSVLVMDQRMLELDPAGLELLWEKAGGAIPVEINLGISGLARVLREVQAALQRREREELLSRRSALQLVEGTLNTTLTGLILTIQLTLAEPGLEASPIMKLHHALALATELSRRIRHSEQQ